MAARHSPVPGTRQSRIPHRGGRGSAPARARARRPGKGRGDRRGGRTTRREAGAGGRVARRHGRIAGHRGSRCAVRVAPTHRVGRHGLRRDARLRPRCAYRDPDGRGRSAGAVARFIRRQRQVHLPAGRGDAARGRGRRRATDGQGGRAGKSARRCDLRPARDVIHRQRQDRLPSRSAAGLVR